MADLSNKNLKSYQVYKHNGKYCVYKKGRNGRQTGNCLGTHDTPEEARQQMAAIYASEARQKAGNKSVIDTGSDHTHPLDARAVTELINRLRLLDASAMPNPGSEKTMLDPDDTLIAFGSAVKSLGIEQKDGRDYAHIGGHLVLFGNDDQKDLVEDFFVSETYYGPRDGDGADTMVHHGKPFKTGDPEIDKELKALSSRLLHPLTTTRDPLGIWAETVLDLSDKYEKYINDLVEKGAFKWSSGTAPHMVIREPNGKIVRWPIVEGSLTPTPAEPRMLRSRVIPLKSYQGMLLDDADAEDFVQELTEQQKILEAISLDDDPVGAPSQGGAGLRLSVANTHSGNPENGEKTMNVIEAISKLVPDLKPQQAEQIGVILELVGASDYAGDDTDEPLEDVGEPEGGAQAADQLTEEPMRSIDPEKLAQALKAIGLDVRTGQKQAVSRPAYEFKPAEKKEPESSATKSFEAAYVTRFGDEKEAMKAVMTDLVGDNYRQTIWDQNRAFAKYLRFGERDLEREEVKLLKIQIFPHDQLLQLIRDGFEVKSIKDVMVEAQGILGGYAVPPNVQANILTRIPGLTAVRKAGAQVITLVNSNSTELTIYDGGDDRYRGKLRGQWGTETQAPTEQHAELKMEAVQAYVYTYKVPFSQSLVEDSANLVTLVETDITDVMAIDEDEVFLIGNGVGKPLGILPGGLNTLGLSEVMSSGSASVTVTGIKKLKRGVASQYRGRASFVANSDTWGDVETLQLENGTFAFPDLSEEDMLLKRQVGESEAMPDIAANAYPILFGDFSGYKIIERLGLTIVRMQDSGTGINKVEYHVRRRIGGRLSEPWKFAVQKIAA